MRTTEKYLGLSLDSRKKAEKAQRMACVATIGATETLFAIHDLSHLDLYCKNVARKSVMRLTNGGFMSRSFCHSRIICAVRTNQLNTSFRQGGSTGIMKLESQKNLFEQPPEVTYLYGWVENGQQSGSRYIF